MENESRRLKVLVVAHELSPYGGSECAVGWNIVTRLASYHDVTVIYASGSQFNDTSYVNSVNRYHQTNPRIDGLTLVNLDKPPVTRFVSSMNYFLRKISPVGLPLLYYIGYSYWQKAVLRKAVSLHAINNFSIVHQLTQITFREPGYLWKLGIPFVWGPTGGTSTFPGSFHRILSFQSRLLDRIRTISLYYQFYFSPRVRKAIKYAATIYVFSRLDEERFKKRANGNVKVMLDVGTYSQIAVKPAVKINQGKLKVIWCGRLDEFKALFILLHSIAGSHLIQQNVTFQIVGSGPLGDSLRISAEKLKLSNIEWTGRVSHEEVFSLMGKADFFVHTSIREATSSVIPEALSMGLPVICHDAYGMGIAINDSCGIKIPLVSPERSIACFRSAIEQLVRDRVLLSNLRRGAFRRVSEINWDNMARTISVDYYNVIVSKQDQ